MHPTTCPIQTNAFTNFPEEIPARPLVIPLGRRRFLTTLGAITSVFALGMEPLMANPGDPAWDAALREPAAAHLARPSANQWEEVLTLCGPDLVTEVWRDGGCIIDIEPTIMRLAPKAVFFAGTKHEPIRWVGNECGIAPDVNWNAIRSEDLTRVHDTHRASDPDGDSWAPMEADTTLYDHYWFWTPANETRRKSVDHLMHLFVKSVGNGSLLLLNSSPNTTGLLPENDVKRYADFGEAIERNFGRPLGRTEAPVVGAEAECAPDGPVTINCADVWEDYRLGHRIREFVVEGRVGGEWVKLAEGEAVGRRKLVFFPPTTVERVRVRVTRSVGTPVIRLLQIHQVDPALAGAMIPPVSRQAPATASSAHSAPYAAAMLVDGDEQTRWGAADGAPDPWVELDLGRPRKIARATLSELADRVRAFRIEYRNAPDGEWRIAHEGTIIGKTWASDFDRVTARFVRLRIQEYTGPAPTLWSWELFDRADAFETVGTWQAGAEGAWDLSTAINEAGRYEMRFIDDDGVPMRVVSAQLFLEGEAAAADNFSGVGETSLRLSRSQAIGPGASSRLQARIDAPAGRTGKALLRPAP